MYSSTLSLNNLRGTFAIVYNSLSPPVAEVRSKAVETELKVCSTALLSRAGLGHIGKSGLLVSLPPYQANGFLYPGGLLMSLPVEDNLTGLTGSSTRLEQVAQIYSLSVAVQHDNLLILTGLCCQETRVTPACRRARPHGRSRYTSLVVLPSLVFLQHQHKPGC